MQLTSINKTIEAKILNPSYADGYDLWEECNAIVSRSGYWSISTAYLGDLYAWVTLLYRLSRHTDDNDDGLGLP